MAFIYSPKSLLSTNPCQPIVSQPNIAMSLLCMQAFAALQHAYSILQRHDCQPEPACMSNAEAEQAAGSQHNRLLLQAYEIPQTCWHMLPPHLQAGAAAIPCNTPFLAFPLDAVLRPAKGPDNTAVSFSEIFPEALTGAQAIDSLGIEAVPVQLPRPFLSGASLVSSKPDVAAAAIAASSEYPFGNPYESAVSGVGVNFVTMPAMQHPPACCSAGTARRSFKTSTSSHEHAVLAEPAPEAMNSPAGSACIAGSTWTAGKTCDAGTAQLGCTDNPSQHNTVSTSPSWQGKGKSSGNRQGQGSSQGQGITQQQGLGQGQGQGQGQTLVQVALLVPCRKAMKDRFPLNGTFFQVNEVFLDHSSLEQPLQVVYLLCVTNCWSHTTSNLIACLYLNQGCGRMQAPCHCCAVALYSCAFTGSTREIHKHFTTFMHLFHMQAFANCISNAADLLPFHMSSLEQGTHTQ